MTIVYLLVALVVVFLLLPPVTALVLPNSVSGKFYLRDTLKKAGINPENVPKSCLDELAHLSLEIAKRRGYEGVALKSEVMAETQRTVGLLSTYLTNREFLEENYSNAEPLAVLIRKYQLTEAILTRPSRLPRARPSTPTTEHRIFEEMLRLFGTGQFRQFDDFLERGVGDINAVNEEGVSLLTLAAGHGYEEAVSDLLERGADANAGNLAHTPLEVASYLGHTEVVRVLLSGGADASMWGKANATGSPAIHSAAEKGHIEIIRLLVSNGASINQQNKAGQTALHYAVVANNEQMVRVLLENGADPAVVDCNGRDPAAHALHRKFFSIYNLIVNYE